MDSPPGEREFAERYPHRRLEDFPEETAPEFFEALEELEQMVGRTATWSAELAPKLPDVITFLTRAGGMIDTLEAEGEKLAGLLRTTLVRSVDRRGPAAP